MIELMKEPWPWYVSGPLISLTLFFLLYFGKNFGLSANFRTMCSIAGAGKVSDFFRFDWKSQMWNIVFIIGILIGGYVANNYLKSETPVQVSENVIKELESFGLSNIGESLAPDEIFGLSNVVSIKGFIFLVIGGILVGFGTRWAGGCTSGHAISGLSDLQLPSLLAVIGFFIGGIIMTYFILPYLIQL